MTSGRESGRGVETKATGRAMNENGSGNVCVSLSLKLISVLQPHSQPPSRCLKPGVEQVVLSRDLGTELHAPAPHAWLQPHPFLVWFSDLTQ